MYTTRYVVRPAGSRVCKLGSCNAARSLSSFPTPSWGYAYGPRFAGADFNNVFRLLDETTRSLDSFPSQFFGLANFPQSLVNESRRSQQQTFAPRFDVQETETGYELRGELPGVDAKDVSVQFTDPRTLVISGSVTRGASSDNQAEAAATQTTEAPAQATEPVQTQAVDDDAASVHSRDSHNSNYQRPSVEEDDFVDLASNAGEESSADATARANVTPATSTTEAAEPQQQQVAAVDNTQQDVAKETANASRYWYSERSVGSFSRTFRFPAAVNTEAVSASLKNGVLAMEVPKAQAYQAKTINVE